MDVNLQVLKSLNNLIKDQPRLKQGLVNDTYQMLDGVIGDIQQTLTQDLIDQVQVTYADAVGTLYNQTNGKINSVQGTVEGTINGIFDGIIEKIQELIDWIRGIIANIQDWFSNLIDQVKNLINNIKTWLNTLIDNVSNWVVTQVNAAIHAVRDWISGVVENVRTWLGNVYNSVKLAVQNVVNNVGDWISGVYNNIADWVQGAIQTTQNFINTLKATVEDKIQDIINWVQHAREAVEEWWNGIKKKAADFINDVILPNLDKLIEGSQKVKDLFKNIWDAIASGDYQKAFDLIDGVFTMSGLPGPIESIRALVSTLAFFWETVHLQFVAMEYQAQKQAVIQLGLEPLDLGTTTQAFYKGLISKDDFIHNANLAGINSQRASVALDANRPLPSAGQIQEAFLRGEIDLAEHDRLLSDYGLTAENIDLIKQLYMIIPGPSDLIRMAVREAFSPEIAQKFGQYQDYPDEFTTWAEKQGLSKEWATRYWAAHWELPSAQMGFEMLHRGVISNEELTLLLRALDVMPYWRERLIKISYNPLTRVDVRRMYKLGVIDEDQVKRAYLDLGYDDEKAGWLTDFTTRYYTPEDQDQSDEFRTMARTTYSQAYKKNIISEAEYRAFLLNMGYYTDDVEMLIQIDNFTRLQASKVFDLDGYRKDWQKLVLNAYDRGLLHKNEVQPMLTDLGYSDQEATMELDLADYNRTLTIRNMVVDQVHDQYVTYILDVPQLHTLLDTFNFTPEEINRLQEAWDIERNLRTRRPSVSDLKTFYKQGLISLQELLDELRGQGYNEKYIPMYERVLA